MERRRLDFDPQNQITTLRDAISYLRSGRHNPETHYYRFVIDVARHPIAATDIRGLTRFPYETSLDEHEGKIVFTTGTRRHVDTNRDISKGKMFMHTHHSGSISQYSPSTGDAVSSNFFPESATRVVVTPNRLLVYRNPRDPETGEQFRGDVRDLLARFYISRSLWGDGGEDKMETMSREQRAKLERGFAEYTHMIVDEARWGDRAGVQRIIDVINLRPRSVNVPAWRRMLQRVVRAGRS